MNLGLWLILSEHRNCNWLNCGDIKIKLPCNITRSCFTFLNPKIGHKLIINQVNSNKDGMGDSTIL